MSRVFYGCLLVGVVAALALAPGCESSRLVRLELRSAESNVDIVLKASLWAQRPPADLPEVAR